MSLWCWKGKYCHLSTNETLKCQVLNNTQSIQNLVFNESGFFLIPVSPKSNKQNSSKPVPIHIELQQDVKRSRRLADGNEGLSRHMHSIRRQKWQSSAGIDCVLCSQGDDAGNQFSLENIPHHTSIIRLQYRHHTYFHNQTMPSCSRGGLLGSQLVVFMRGLLVKGIWIKGILL